MHRLFVGIRPPAAIRAQLLDLMTGVEHARWQDDEQLHLTLRFVGEVERPVAEDVAAALGTIRFPRFTLALDGAGCFDRRGRVTALWAGVRPHAEVAALHRKVDQALVRAGLPPEGRSFLPHVTIARCGAGTGPVAPFLARHACLTSAPFEVAHVLLFESHLARDGARYEAVARYALE